VSDSQKQKDSPFKLHSHLLRKKWLVVGVILAIVVLVAVVVGYLLISKLASTAKDNSSTGKVLTIKDLENPGVNLADDTSDASVENLTKSLKDKIDKQIVARENPFEAVNQLAGVLANTTNKSRQYQLADFIQDFLAKHENALWFETESGVPDQAQVNYWKSELYASLVYNYQFIMQNKFTGSDGKPIDTTKEQLKYIDLYLALANDSKSHIVITEENKEFLADYQYNEAGDFLKIKNELATGRNDG